MTFKRFQGQIFDVELTKKEQRALDEAITQQTIEHFNEFADDFEYMIMYIFHKYFGFGLTRLRRIHDVFIAEYDALVKYYEMPDADVYIARKMMNKFGCNIEEWNQERSE